MEEEFWQSRWREDRTPFHEDQPNALLTAHFDRLALSPGDHVFVPLCGKALDLDWLIAQGLKVSGAEFSDTAVRAVFDRQGLEPEIVQTGALTLYSAGSLRLFAGDIFDINADMLGPVDAIYDRAALVALPADMRAPYAAHLSDITGRARQLLIAYDYDQSQTEGPPFSVPTSEIQQLYAATHQVAVLSSGPIEGPLLKRCEGSENALLLTGR